MGLHAHPADARFRTPKHFGYGMASPTSSPRFAGSRFPLAARVTLVLTFVVILAGSIVRSTGAGMGCPDWPKCFGHYVPPTDISELQYEKGRAFSKGHFIIWNEALWKARRDLVATDQVNPADWEKYTKHDYAVFNAAHTWTEYANRLSGVLLGLAAIWMVIASLKHWRSDRTAVLAAIGALLLISFEGWLGALVVESNLAPVKITTHMVVALAIVALIVWIVRRARGDEGFAAGVVSRASVRLIVGCLVLTIVQVVLGTQVREQVDELVGSAVVGADRATIVEQLGTYFEVHRSFAWALLVVNAALIMRILKEGRGMPRLQRRAVWLAVLLLISVGSGIALAWMEMPAPMQPTHLLLASLLFGLQFAMLLDVRRRRAPVAPAIASERAALEQPVS
jgi:cytochrome c oxidase assembly protein subunit 15